MKRKYKYKLQRENGDSLRYSKIIEDEAFVIGSEPRIITWKQATRPACALTQKWHTRLKERRLERGDGRF
ncbi:hypothetical protein ACFQ5D_07440 [Paenibacillus farraposensis]|uniref:Uncharacterized protein n=1 Tax=Paenibacillus farraposensis TaxID=2807095 RepID=A0ABW4DE69_9BACL|nr:hypothetical protein [Paenibacillus farraposensis]MCC3380390.1 hypothetical protein [Paenibacillus farraposensis]